MNWGRPEAWPWMAGVALLALAVAWALRRRVRSLRSFAVAEHLAEMVPGWWPAGWRWAWTFRAAALLCLALALLRPQWGIRREDVTRNGLDIAVVLDTSRSMSADDLAPNRLQQAKWGIHELLREPELAGDRVALVPFAGSSVVQCPLTTDYAAFAMTLDDVYCGIIPRGGTAIEQALRTTLAEALPEPSPDDPAPADQVILLITDGEDHEGDPLALLPELKRRGIRVYAIGIATPGGAMLPDASGTGYFKNRQGQAVQSVLREDVLQRLALETGGTYVRSAPGDAGLSRVFRESIADLRRAERESRLAEVRVDRFQWLLFAALLALAAEALLPRRRLGRAD